MLFNKLVEKVAATEKLHLVGFIFWNLFWLKLRNRHFYLYHRFWGTPARSLVKCILQELAILFDRNTLFRFPLNFFNFRFWPLWAYSWKLNYKLLMSNKHVCFWKKIKPLTCCWLTIVILHRNGENIVNPVMTGLSISCRTRTWYQS